MASRGRWAHAFYLAPETIRIPLIMHVPQRLREGRRWDPEAVAMLTDVTPTLYELLGYGPVPPRNLLAGLSSNQPAVHLMPRPRHVLDAIQLQPHLRVARRACPVALRRQRQRGARGVL